MKRWKWVVGLLLVGLLGVAVARGMSAGVPVEVVACSERPIEQFVEDRGITRLPRVYTITMPINARLTQIDLLEGQTVKKGETVARVVPLDIELRVEAAQAAVQRLEASIRENDDASVELTGLKQTLNFVTSMDRAVEAAAARVESGKAKLEYAERNLARMKRLYERNQAQSADDVERAEVAKVEASVEYQQDLLVLRSMQAMQAATALTPTAVRQYIARKALTREVLEKQLAEANSTLKQVLEDKRRADIPSPIDGTVLERLSIDEKQVPAGAALLKIGRLEDLEAEVDVLSQDVVAVKVGDRAEISGPAIGPKPVGAKVVRIHPAGFMKVSSLGVEQQRVKVIVKFDPGDLEQLRKTRVIGPEYRVSVRIITAEKPQALVAPRSALFRGTAGDWQVFAVRNDRAELVSVEIGLSNDQLVEITKGLTSGELVVLAPPTTLVSGTRVTPEVRTLRLAEDQPNGD